MPVQITNQSHGPWRGLLTVQLNSGESLYLAPSETSPPLDDQEVVANRWVQRLLDRGLIAVEEVAAPTPANPRPATRRKRSSQA